MPVGIGVYGTTARIEKGYRAYGDELDAEYDLVEAGMQRPKVKDADFVGREAYLKQRDEPPAALLCTLTLDHQTSASCRPGPLHARRRADPDPAGEPLTDALGHHRTSRVPGPARRSGKHLLMSYLPPERGGGGQPAARELPGGPIR